MSLRWFLVAVGAAAMLVGIVLGFTPVSADGVYGVNDSFSCGSAFAPNLDEAAARDMMSDRVGWNLGLAPGGHDTPGACEDAIGSRPAFAWVLLGGGTVLAFGGLIVRGEGRAPRSATQEDRSC